MRTFVRDFFKYLVVAVVALGVDFGTLLLLNKLGLQYLLAATTSFTLGSIVNFLLGHGFVFKDPVIKNRTANFVAYVAIGFVGLFCNNIIIWFAVSRLGLGLAIAKAIAVAIVFMWNFLARRQFLYKGHKVPVEKELSFEA